MAELTPEEIAINDAKIVAEKAATELKSQSKAEALRELSTELGINAFEPKEVKAKFDEFTKWQTDQKSEQEVLQGEVDAYKLKETAWLTKENEYASKLKASELGISQDKLEDALKLAGGKVENLAEVLKKYPVFKSESGVTIGVQDPNNFQDPNGGSEAELYMAKNERLYGKPKK